MCIANKLKVIMAAPSILMLMIMVIPQVSFGGETKATIVLNTTGKPPLNDAQMKGFMDLVAEEAFKRIGVTLKTVALPAERGLLNANNHKVDGEMSRIAGIQGIYPNLVQVPEKIMDWEFVAIGEPGLHTEDGWQSLAGRRVAFINGWKILEQNITPVAMVKKVKGPDSLFRLLQNQRIDYVVYERWAGAKHIQDKSLKQVRNNLPALAKREMFIYLHKEHTPLVNKLAAALRNMKSDGTYKNIKERTLKHYVNR